MSLPVETIVIIAIAVLVMVVLVVFFVSGAGTQITRISDQNALTSGCTDFVIRYHCDSTQMANVHISGYNATCGGETGSNTLTVACCKAGFTDPAICATIACRCS
jgi:hypothetical protein